MGIVLRGQVTAYPEDNKTKGLVEVTVGAYDKDRSTVYAVVEQPMTGVYWLPELGDVVDVDIPDMLGYEARIIQIHRKEGDKQVSACWTKDNDVKQFKTRSGHTITLDDTKDKALVSVKTGGGLELKLDDKAKTVTVHGTSDKPSLVLDVEKDAVTLKAGKSLSIQCGGAELKFDSSGNVSLSTNGKLDIIARDVSIEAKMSFKAKGQQTELNGGMTTKVSGQTRLELSSSAITEVKGGMVKLN